jgi:hypothetical protein
MFRDGGFPMFFILGFGLVALAVAGWYASRPAEKHEGFLKGMSAATFFSVLVGLVTDLATVFKFVASKETDPQQRTRIVFEGLAESMSPGIMGFAILSLVALLYAVGKRRLDARRLA